MAKEIFLKIIAVLFVGIFAVTAAYMAYMIATSINAVERARNWAPTPAKVIRYGLVEGGKNSSAIRDAETVEHIKAEYTYVYDGKAYTGTVVDFTRGHADNFSQDRRAKQMRMLAKGDIDVYVNPEKPDEAVVDRSLPAEKVLFCTFFLLFPCGFATMFVVFTLLSPFKPVYVYAPQIWGILHSLPAVWLLLRYAPEYGVRGLMLLTLISAIMPFAVYRGFVKFRTNAKG